MDLSPFKQDIDELIDEFAQGDLKTLADMKRVWLSRKFSYIYEASPSSNLSLFMQTLYAQSIRHMVSNDSLSRRLGGLYCLYCLYEVQPFKPPFKVYISLGELKKLKDLVLEAKKNGIRVVPALVKRMLERNVFLFGYVDLNENSISETVKQLTDLQNARVQVAYEKLFADTRVEHYVHMDLGMEVDLNVLQKMSTEYADAKKQAIEEAREVVDVENIQHLVDDQELMGEVVGKITDDWNRQREAFYQQTQINQQRPVEPEQRQLHLTNYEQVGDDQFERELEQFLSRE